MFNKIRIINLLHWVQTNLGCSEGIPEELGFYNIQGGDTCVKFINPVISFLSADSKTAALIKKSAAFKGTYQSSWNSLWQVTLLMPLLKFHSAE